MIIESGRWDIRMDAPFHKEAREAVLAKRSSWPSIAEFLDEVERWRLAMVAATAREALKDKP